MALSRVGGSSAASTSIAIPAHVAGDLIVIWAFRDGSTTPPTKPTAGGTVPSFTTVDGPTGANSCSAICAWAFATGTTDTSGTWTNATGISVEVWRGADANSPIGGHAQSGASVASGANIVIPAITLQDPTGASAILAFAGHRNVTAWNAPPAGYTQRSQVATEVEAVTKDTTTSDGTFNVTCTASATGGARMEQLEIVASFGNRVSQQAVEALYSNAAAKARVSQTAVEVLQSSPPSGFSRVSQQAVEVLRSTYFPGSKSQTAKAKIQVTGTKTQTAAARVQRTLTKTQTAKARVRNTAVTKAQTAKSRVQAATLTKAQTARARVQRTLTKAQTSVASISTGSVTRTKDQTAVARVGTDSRFVLTASGTLELAGDDAQIYLIAPTPFAFLVLQSDGATALSFQADSGGALILRGDEPGLLSQSPSNSGAFLLRADLPSSTYARIAAAGTLMLRGDSPNTFPVPAAAGKIALLGDGPTVIPNVGAGGRLLVRADAADFWPLSVSNSGKLVMSSDGPFYGSANIILTQSGILRLRSDVPVIIPLTEPQPPPPNPGSGNVSIRVTV